MESETDLASENPIVDDNIAYTFHFYAGTHASVIDTDDSGNIMGGNVQNALDNGVAVFASEWGGTSQANGTDGVYVDEANLWLEFMNKNNISWINWSLTNKDETSGAFQPYIMGAQEATSLDPGDDKVWAIDELSVSGEYVRQMIRGGEAYTPIERTKKVVIDNSAELGLAKLPSDFEDDTRQGWYWAGESGVKGDMLIEEVGGSKAISFEVVYPDQKPADAWESGPRMVLGEINIEKGESTAFSYDLYLEPTRATTGRLVAYLAFSPPEMGYWAQPLHPVPIELSELESYEEVSDGVYHIAAVFDLTELIGFKMMRVDTLIRDVTIVVADEESDFMGKMYIDNVQFRDSVE